jgi:beta-lactam-binding protein with PASTA domain
MASEADRVPPAEDTVLMEAEDTVLIEGGDVARADEEWPVDDLYLVEPEEPVLGSTDPDAGDTAVLHQAEPSAAPARRRFPPDLSTGLLAIIGAVGALILVAVLLGLRQDEPTRAATPGASMTSPQSNTSPTPAPKNGEIAVRDVTGMPLGKARSVLEEEGLRVRASRQESDTPRGEVLNQEPPPGSNASEGDVIALVVSSGQSAQSAAQGSSVPSVVGLRASAAVSAIREAGLEARMRFVSSSERAGTVLAQTPEEGSETAAGDTVLLEVAKSRQSVQQVDVPDVLGIAAAEARRALRTVGFTVSVAGVPSDEPAGTVIAQSPRAGADVRKGTSVELRVSTGPTDGAVPDVMGMDEQSATLELESAGFEVRVVDEPTTDPAQDGLVVRQMPAGGSNAARGAVVTLTVGRLG